MVDNEGIYIVWPEKRWVDPEKIKMWYSDACENRDITDEEFLNLTDVEEMAKALDDAGMITIGRPPITENTTLPLTTVDKICMNVELFMKVLEYAQEETHNAVQLHRLLANCICMNKTNDVLIMADYPELIKDVKGSELDYLKKLAGINKEIIEPKKNLAVNQD